MSAERISFKQKLEEQKRLDREDLETLGGAIDERLMEGVIFKDLITEACRGSFLGENPLRETLKARFPDKEFSNEEIFEAVVKINGFLIQENHGWVAINAKKMYRKNAFSLARPDSSMGKQFGLPVPSDPVVFETPLEDSSPGIRSDLLSTESSFLNQINNQLKVVNELAFYSISLISADKLHLLEKSPLELAYKIHAGETGLGNAELRDKVAEYILDTWMLEQYGDAATAAYRQDPQEMRSEYIKALKQKRDADKNWPVEDMAKRQSVKNAYKVLAERGSLGKVIHDLLDHWSKEKIHFLVLEESVPGLGRDLRSAVALDF